MPQVKLGNILVMFPSYQNCACFENHLKGNKHNSPYFMQKQSRIFVLGHYLFLKAHIFLRATLSENCLRFVTDIMSADEISEHIFVPNGDYCLLMYTKKIKERCITILFHAIENTVANQINKTYAQGTMGRPRVISSVII